MQSLGLLVPVICCISASKTLMKTLCLFSASSVVGTVQKPAARYCAATYVSDWIA